MDLATIGAALVIIQKKIGNLNGAIKDAKAAASSANTAAAAANTAAAKYAGLNEAEKTAKIADDMRYTVMQAQIRSLADEVEKLSKNLSALV